MFLRMNSTNVIVRMMKQNERSILRFVKWSKLESRRCPLQIREQLKARGQREDVLKAKLKDHLSEEQWTAYQGFKSEQKRIEQEARSLPPREMVMGLARTQEPKQMFVLQRGSPHVPGEPVDPDFPEIFNSESLELTSLKPSEKSSGRRRAPR